MLVNQFDVGVERQNLDEDFDGSLAEETAGSEQLAVNPAPSSSSTSSSGMDKLIYEMVADEEEEDIENAFETTALRTTAVKGKLDMAIDQTILKLQSLKNLRRHIEKAYQFADKFISSKLTNKDGRRLVLAELQKSIDQVEETLNSSSANAAQKQKPAKGQ